MNILRVSLPVMLILAGCSATSSNSADGSGQFGPEPAERIRGREVSWDTGLLEDLGHSLTVSFTGGPEGNIEENPCAAEYDAETVESDDAVTVSVYTLELADPLDLPDEFGCDDVGHLRAVGVTIGAEGLGDRDAIDGATGVARPLIDETAILLPTVLPEGWVELSRHPDGPALTISYGPAGHQGFPPLSYLVAPTDNGFYNLDRDKLKADLTTLEEVGIRGNEQGSFIITSLEDGARSIVFEHGGRFHRVTIQSGIDRAVGLEFVEALS